MRRIVIIFSLMLFVVVSYAQPVFDLGVKAGLNSSKLSLNASDYNEESITKMHWGAFTRVGVSRVYIQPEVYFTKKGGGFTDINDLATEFDYKSVDVPLLLGVKLFESNNFNFRVMAGPVFGFVTKNDVKNVGLDEQYFKDHYTGLQYGVGMDVLFLTVDFRLEEAGKIYNSPDLDAKNRTFMISVGFKIL
ncbi:MAG: porin family protein [Draconibacterium sp.]